ncbi:MAG: hypothetical protein J1F43_04610 [Muribaculaceae bacterium]|nr:hypothetical protein [Muribaculaceae bacterium]
MKRIFSLISLLTIALSLFADINGAGYYRVKNYGSSRWATLIDNHGSVDEIAFTADLHALQLTNNTAEILSDPGSVIYLTTISGNRYDIATQGTSLQALAGVPITILKDGSADGQALYRMYGSKSGVIAYIGDGRVDKSQEYGIASISHGDNYLDYIKWEVIPVDVNSANYFGAVPDVKAGNQLFTTLFTSFAYKPYSSGVKAYYVGRVGFGMVEMIEITDAVPPGSPVIIQCAGTNAADNKLQLLTSQEALPNNALTGVYFNYQDNQYKNFVAYNPSSMRVLGVCKDGSLGFITSSALSGKNIPANSAYLNVPGGASPEFKCVSTAEFEANLPDQPEQFSFGNGQYILQPQDDYIYTGVFNIPAQSNLAIQFVGPSSGSGDIIVGPYNTGGKNQNITVNTNLPFEYGNNASWIIPEWKGGNLYVTLNLQYQTVTIANSAAIGSIATSPSNLSYNGRQVVSGTGDAIRIIDMAGKIVATGVESVDVSNLPKGIYVATSSSGSLKLAR